MKLMFSKPVAWLIGLAGFIAIPASTLAQSQLHQGLIATAGAVGVASDTTVDSGGTLELLANAQLTRSAQQAMDATGRYLLAADDEGKVRWCTTQAARLLGAFAAPEQLPLEVIAWLKAHGTGAKHAHETIIAGPNEAAQALRVEFSLVGALGPDEHLLRLVALNQDHDLDRLHARMKLTRREAEVLLWLARGRTPHGRDPSSALLSALHSNADYAGSR